MWVYIFSIMQVASLWSALHIRSMILNQWQFCLFGDIWQYLGTFLATDTGELLASGE